MSTNKIKLSEAEWKVMKLLWEESPKTMMQITNLLKETTGWTKHTVMTFLKRMEEKKAIHYEEGGRAKLYYPDIKKEEVVLQETEEFLHKVFDGRMGLMLNTMVEKKVLSKSEIDELYDIVQLMGDEVQRMTVRSHSKTCSISVDLYNSKNV